MKVLLDTHAFLWAITGDARLTDAQRAVFTDSGSSLWLSVVSVWEILIKVGIGKLPLPAPAAAYVFRQMDRNRISFLPVRPAHLAELEGLGPLHRDPFDRMLVAQAKTEQMTLMSGDELVRQYGVTVI